MSDVTKEGDRLIRAWQDAQKRVRTLRSQLNGAECDERNAELELSRWLLPADAVKGEQVAVWSGDSLVQATAEENNAGKWTGKVRLRLRGKHWGER